MWVCETGLGTGGRAGNVRTVCSRLWGPRRRPSDAAYKGHRLVSARLTEFGSWAFRRAGFPHTSFALQPTSIRSDVNVAAMQNETDPKPYKNRFACGPRESTALPTGTGVGLGLFWMALTHSPERLDWVHRSERLVSRLCGLLMVP